MSRANSATIKIRGDNKDLEDSLKQSEGDFKKFGQTLKRLAIAAVAALAIGKLISALKGTVKVASEAETSLFKLERMMKVTGERAGFTSDQIVQLAENLEDASRFSKNAAIDAATAISKFQNIKGDVFDDTLKSAADLAVVMGTDLKTAAVQLAGALDEPNKAIALMDDLGATLSMSQEILVQRLARSGQTMAAQRIILAKLQETYGGSATADLQTFAGRWEKTKNSMKAAGETIGETLLPAIEAAMPLVEAFVAGFQTAADYFQNTLAPAVTDAWNGMLETISPLIEAMKTRIAVMIEGATSLFNAFFGPTLDSSKSAFQSLVDFILPIMEAITTGIIVAFTTIEVAITNWKDIAIMTIELFALATISAFNTVVHMVTVTIPEAISWFLSNWKEVFETAWNFLKTVFSNMMENAKRFGKSLVSFFKGDGFNFKWKGLLDGFENTIKEMPEFTKRIPSQLEKDLAADISRLGDKIGKSFNDKLQKRLGKIAETRKKLFGPDEQSEGEEQKKKVDTTPDKSKFGKFGTKQFKAPDTGAGSFEGLEALNKRIQSAAMKSPQLKALEGLHKFQFGAEKKRQKQTEETNKLLKEGNDTTKKALKIAADDSGTPSTAMFG